MQDHLQQLRVQHVIVLQGKSMCKQMKDEFCILYLFINIYTILCKQACTPLLPCRKSASCTHVSALLHALVSMTTPQFQLRPTESPGTLLSDEEESQPVTSLPCQWKPPRKRKESTLPLAEASFAKHEF